MTTHVYKQYDPQTRKLVLVRPNTTVPVKNAPQTVVGGTNEDDSSLVLHISYTQEDYLDTHTPYIIFDVKNDQGENIFYYPGSSPISFDGVEFNVPAPVMRAVKNNYLRYVLAFTELNTHLDRVEFEQSALDVLEIPHSYVDSLLIRPGIPSGLSENATPMEWIEYMKRYAVFNPVQFDEANSEFTFKSYTGNSTTVSIAKARPMTVTYPISPLGWTRIEDENGVHYERELSGPGVFSENKLTVMSWNRETADYACLADLSLKAISGTTAILRAECDPSTVWNGHTVKLDFLLMYGSDVTSVVQQQTGE